MKSSVRKTYDAPPAFVLHRAAPGRIIPMRWCAHDYAMPWAADVSPKAMVHAAPGLYFASAVRFLNDSSAACRRISTEMSGREQVGRLLRLRLAALWRG